ncbi:hypothetical protein [Kribbella deserti]|uniref:DUF397 domain-containing protein n=1 Tax=Kribbella deserti TaxID=1926257 RepID=A0ABV6QRA8_9ACTN
MRRVHDRMPMVISPDKWDAVARSTPHQRRRRPHVDGSRRSGGHVRSVGRSEQFP